MSVWVPPCYSLEDRRPRPSEKLHRPCAPPAALVTRYPDEEKGRKTRAGPQLVIPEFRVKENSPHCDFVLPPARGFLGATPVVPTDCWADAISHAFESSNGTIDLSYRNLSTIPTAIKDLLFCVALEPNVNLRSTANETSGLPRSGMSPVAAGRRGFARTQSVPFASAQPTVNSSSTSANSNGFNRALSVSSLSFDSARSLGQRSRTQSGSKSSALPLQIYLASNTLSARSFPSSFFTLSNLIVLSLRNNQLEELSAGIGRLKGLVELSLGGNQLRWLPAEFAQLGSASQAGSLEKLALYPNPWLKPPSPPLRSTLSASASPPSRLLAPVKTHFAVPSLREILTRKLLAPSPWEPELRLVQDTIFGDATRLLPEHLHAPFEGLLSAPNDKSFDYEANVCRSEAHSESPVWYTLHAEERFEWVSQDSLVVDRAKCTSSEEGRGRRRKDIPVLWRGCSRGCLDWLDTPDYEEEERDRV